MSKDTHIAGYPRQLASHLELRRVLGEGGSSIVFEAFHTRLKVAVAVKLLSVRGSIAEQARLRLLREAELYALLDDPRIPRVYDVDELPDGTPYVVMEFVPGGSLEALLTQGPLSPRRAVTIAKEVLSALAYVHARGVLHRDVKPANVILSESQGKCQVRLVDFGIAKVFDDPAEMGAPLTQQGTLVGTPHYMAPERFLGHAADERADVYAVGVMLYEMLSGHAPFTGPTLGEVIASVLRDVPRPVHDVCAHVPAALGRIVMRAIERDPAARYPGAEEMLAALKSIESTLEGEISSPRIVPAARSVAPAPRSATHPRSFSSLEVDEDDLFPRRRSRIRNHWPLALVACLGVVVWIAWPGAAREHVAPGASSAQPSQAGQPSPTDGQPASPDERAAAVAPESPAQLPHELLPASGAPMAVPPSDAADAGLQNGEMENAEGTIEGGDLELSPTLVPSDGDGVLEAPGLAQPGTVERSNWVDPRLGVEQGSAAQPQPRAGSRARRSSRTADDEEEARREDESRRRLRAVPLEPVLEDIDRALEPPAVPPASSYGLPEAAPEPSEPAHPSQKSPKGLPENPY